MSKRLIGGFAGETVGICHGAPRIRCGPFGAHLTEATGTAQTLAALVVKTRSTIRFRVVIQVCESVQPRSAVSRYGDVCLNEMATELGFERVDGASSAAGNEFAR